MSSNHVLQRLSQLCTICQTYKNIVYMIGCDDCQEIHCETCAEESTSTQNLGCYRSLIKRGKNKNDISYCPEACSHCKKIIISCSICGRDICKDCSVKCYIDDCNLKFCGFCAYDILDEMKVCGGHEGNPDY